MKFCDGPLEKKSQFYYREHNRDPLTVEYSASLHIHQSAEILYVQHGKIEIRITGKPSETINDGEAALFFPFQAHEYHRAAGTHYIRFNFDSELASDFFNPNKNLAGVRNVFKVSDSTAILIQKRSDTPQCTKLPLLLTCGFCITDRAVRKRCRRRYSYKGYHLYA